MKTYTKKEVKAMLKKQRELCAEAQDYYTTFEEQQRDIKNAPEPEFPKKTITHLKADFEDDALNEAWESWVKHRREKRNTITPSTARVQKRMLNSIPPNLAIQSINNSIQNGWTGLFLPKASDMVQDQPKQQVTTHNEMSDE